MENSSSTSSNNNKITNLILQHDILKKIVLNNNDYIRDTIKQNLEKLINSTYLDLAMSRIEYCCSEPQTEFLVDLTKYYVNNIGIERPNVTAISFAILLYYYHVVLLEIGKTQLVDSRDKRFKILPIYNQIQRTYIDLTIGDGEAAKYVRRSILGFLDLPDVSGNDFTTGSIPIPDYEEVRNKIKHRDIIDQFWRNIAQKRPASQMLQENPDTFTGGRKKNKSIRMKKSKNKTKNKHRK